MFQYRLETSKLSENNLIKTKAVKKMLNIAQIECNSKLRWIVVMNIRKSSDVCSTSGVLRLFKVLILQHMYFVAAVI